MLVTWHSLPQCPKPETQTRSPEMSLPPSEQGSKAARVHNCFRCLGARCIYSTTTFIRAFRSPFADPALVQVLVHVLFLNAHSFNLTYRPHPQADLTEQESRNFRTGGWFDVNEPQSPTGPEQIQSTRAPIEGHSEDTLDRVQERLGLAMLKVEALRDSNGGSSSTHARGQQVLQDLLSKLVINLAYGVVNTSLRTQADIT